MKFAIILFVVLLPTVGMNQSISNSVIAASGTYYANSQSSLDWTIGEPIIESYASAVTLTQGFHQTRILPVLIDEISSDSSHIKIYPNPAQDYIHIQTPIHQSGQPAILHATISILTMAGVEIESLNTQLFEPSLRMDIHGLKPATYILIVSLDNQKKSFVFSKL